MDRLFIAIGLSDELKEQFFEYYYTPELDVKWVPPENLHLTLTYLGPQEPPVVDELAGLLDEVRFTPFAFKIGELRTFSKGGEPTALVLDIHSPVLLDLKKQVDTAIQPLDIRLESRKFHPHITLARVGQYYDMDLIVQILENKQKLDWEPVSVDSFYIYSSHLTPKQAHYRQLVEFPADEPEQGSDLTVCSRCGKDMSCKPQGGCWCMEGPPLALPPNDYDSCLCPQCLKALAELHTAQKND